MHTTVYRLGKLRRIIQYLQARVCPNVGQAHRTATVTETSRTSRIARVFSATFPHIDPMLDNEPSNMLKSGK
jgi:hypothetical protein